MERCTREFRCKPFIVFYDIKSLRINSKSSTLFRDFIENLKNDTNSHDKLSIILNTPGGSAETVEKMVAIIRHHRLLFACPFILHSSLLAKPYLKSFLLPSGPHPLGTCEAQMNQTDIAANIG